MAHVTYTVPAISCGHCKQAIETQVAKVPGVVNVAVDIATKTVLVDGSAADGALRAALESAGYTPVSAHA